VGPSLISKKGVIRLKRAEASGGWRKASPESGKKSAQGTGAYRRVRRGEEPEEV